MDLRLIIIIVLGMMKILYVSRKAKARRRGRGRVNMIEKTTKKNRKLRSLITSALDVIFIFK